MTLARPEVRDLALDVAIDELELILELARVPVSDRGRVHRSTQLVQDRAAAHDAALTSLVGRGIVRQREDGAVELVYPYDTVFGVVTEPGLVVECTVRAEANTHRRTQYVRTDAAVEQSYTDDERYRFAWCDPAGLLDRLITFLGLRFVAPTLTPANPVPIHEGAKATNSGGDLVPVDARLCQVSCVHKTEGVLAGGELTWYSRDGDLWLVEREPSVKLDEGDEKAQLKVRSVTSGWIVNELLDYLPGGALVSGVSLPRSGSAGDRRGGRGTPGPVES